MLDNYVSELPHGAKGSDIAASATPSDFLTHFRSFFNFNTYPFNNTPDPNFFYTSPRHQEALINLQFGVEQRRGFIVLTGEIGSGKTTLCRQFLQSLSPDIKSAVILNPNISATHLLGSVVQDFGIALKRKSKRDIYDAMSRFLLEGMEHNQNACLIIDEAQCLNVKVLEEVRLLSNLETPKQKLLQIILIGQPELKDLLKTPSLMQLRQRIGVYAHLSGLNFEEVKNYIYHRLKKAAQGENTILFDTEVITKIHEMSRGIPRLINTICDRILMAAFMNQTKHITLSTASRAFEELQFICEDSTPLKKRNSP